MLRFVLKQGILFIASCVRIDMLALAYEQRELCVCDIGEREFLHHVLSKIIVNISQPILLDCGANKGDYTAWILEAIPNAKVLGFEPNPKMFSLYVSRFLGDSRVQAFQLGLGNEITSGTLYTPSCDELSAHATLSKSVLDDTSYPLDLINCRLETLNHLAECEPLLNRVAYIKLDVEGYELQVLQGADKILNSSTLVAIQFEFNSMNIDTKVFLKDFYSLLGPRFDFYRLNSKGMEPLGFYSERNELFTYQNLVAIKRCWSHVCASRWPRVGHQKKLD